MTNNKTKKINKNKTSKSKTSKSKTSKSKTSKSKTSKSKTSKSKITKKIKPIFILKKFNNEMKYFIKEIPNSKNISINFMIKTGGINEGKYLGLSHLLEHMLFTGTESYPNRIDLIKNLEKYGAIINGSTTLEITTYYMTFPAKYLFKILPILFEMIYKSNLDSYILDEEKKVVLNELYQRKDDLKSYYRKLSRHDFLKNTPYRDFVIGNNKTINMIEKYHLHSYIISRYRPENCIISIVGKLINPIKDIVNEVKKYFDIDASKILDYYKFESNHKKYNNYIESLNYFNNFNNKLNSKILKLNYNYGYKNHIESNVSQVYIHLLFNGIPIINKNINDEKNNQLELFIYNYLSSGMNNELFNLIRSKNHLVYNIKIQRTNLNLINGGIFQINYNMMPDLDNIKKSISLVFNLLNKLKTQELNSKEINYVINKSNNRKISNNLQSDDIATLKSYDYLFNNIYSKHFKKYILTNKNNKNFINAKNIKDYANKIFNKNKMNIFIVSKENYNKSTLQLNKLLKEL